MLKNVCKNWKKVNYLFFSFLKCKANEMGYITRTDSCKLCYAVVDMKVEGKQIRVSRIFPSDPKKRIFVGKRESAISSNHPNPSCERWNGKKASCFENVIVQKKSSFFGRMDGYNVVSRWTTYFSVFISERDISERKMCREFRATVLWKLLCFSLCSSEWMCVGLNLNLSVFKKKLFFPSLSYLPDVVALRTYATGEDDDDEKSLCIMYSTERELQISRCYTSTPKLKVTKAPLVVRSIERQVIMGEIIGNGTEKLTSDRQFLAELIEVCSSLLLWSGLENWENWRRWRRRRLWWLWWSKRRDAFSFFSNNHDNFLFLSSFSV